MMEFPPQSHPAPGRFSVGLLTTVMRKYHGKMRSEVGTAASHRREDLVAKGAQFLRCRARAVARTDDADVAKQVVLLRVDLLECRLPYRPFADTRYIGHRHGHLSRSPGIHRDLPEARAQRDC